MPRISRVMSVNTIPPVLRSWPINRGTMDTTIALKSQNFDKAGRRLEPNENRTESRTRAKMMSTGFDHFINSRVITVAKKTRAKEVRTNWGTLSIRNRAMTDSVTPTAA